MTELSSGCVARSYSWGPDLSGSLQGAGGIGGLVFVRDSSTSGSYYPAYDGNGNVTAMVLASSGAAVATYEYSPYGELLTSTGSYAGTNPFRFSTKYTDSETGLPYFGYRYYNPETGRWINRDPIEENGGLNLYAYVDNMPSKNIDINGLAIYKCIRKTDFGIGNHAYLWSDPSSGGHKSCGMSNSSGKGGDQMNNENDLGPNGKGQYCVKISGSDGKEKCVMSFCECDSNTGPWIPGSHDCHNAADRALQHCGLSVPPLSRWDELWEKKPTKKTQWALGG
jgi:RHS repeat-associated protein